MQEASFSPTPQEAPRPSIPTGPEKTSQREMLPIAQHEQEIKQALQTHDEVIVVGQTGSGKTTKLPLYMYDVVSALDPNAKVIVTQPRRLAARKLALTVQKEVGVGKAGYRYKNSQEDSRKRRDGNKITEETKLVFTVHRSLVNELQKDPLLSEYTAAMVDEVHDRTIDIDIELALLKQAQAKRKQFGLKPLKIVCASATLDQEKLGAYFDRASQFDVEGRLWPVTDHFADSPIEREDMMSEAAKKAAEIITNPQKAGDILIFMPGKAEIEKTIAELGKYVSTDTIDIIPLMGGEQDAEQQDKAFEKTGRRKIIVATNVAETSITIDTVTAVIDSGLMKSNIYDSRTGITSLQVVEHTKSNWKQRKGRAGRVAAGDAYALFTEEQLDARSEYPAPEMQRTNLTELVLQMKNMGIHNISDFDFLDHPGRTNIENAIQTLQQLGALDKTGTITEIGSQMAEIPLDPHYSRMLVEAKNRDCVEPVSVLIGFLSNTRKSVFQFNPKTERFAQKYAEFVNPNSDFLTLLNVWNANVQNYASKEANVAWTEAKGLNRKALLDVGRTKNDILREEYIRDLNISRKHAEVDMSDPAVLEAIQKSVAAGFLDQVLVRQRNGTYTLQNGKKTGIEIDRKSALKGQEPEMLVSGNITFVEQIKKTFANLNQRVTQQMLDAIKADATVAASVVKENQQRSKLPPVPSLASMVEESQKHTRKSFWKKLWKFFRS